MPILHHDYETRSVLYIEEVGAWRYSQDPSTEVWGCAFAVDDGPIEWWRPGEVIPEPFVIAAQDPTWLTSAYNDTFERLITQHVTGPRYGFPLVPIERRRCLQASSLLLALELRDRKFQPPGRPLGSGETRICGAPETAGEGKLLPAVDVVPT